MQAYKIATEFIEKYEGRTSRGRRKRTNFKKKWILYTQKFLRHYMNPLYWLKKFRVKKKLKTCFSNLFSIFIPWEHSIKEIESHFGTVVASYFLFLRWLLSMNLVICILIGGLVIWPEYVIQKGGNWFGGCAKL